MVRHNTPHTAGLVTPPLSILSARSHHRNTQPESTTYELVPAAALPFVDLSISIKSRYMSRRQLDAFDGFMRRFRRPLLLGYALGVMLYPLTLVLPFTIANPLSISVVCLCAIPSVSLFSTLRFDLVTAMLSTFDFWLCTIVGWSTFFVLSAIVGDAPSRSLAVVIAMFGVQANIMIDANLREARNWVWVNCIGVMVHLFVAGWSSVCLIPRQRFFAVFKFGDHQVPSESFVSSGLLTVAALIARNVFRKHRARAHRRDARMQSQVLAKAPSLPIIECVSYRTMLKFVEKDAVDIPARLVREPSKVLLPRGEHDAWMPSTGPAIPRVSTRIGSDQPYLQRLRHLDSVGAFNASDTVSHALFAWIRDGKPSKLRRCCSTSFHAFGFVAAAFSFLGGVANVQLIRESAAQHSRSETLQTSAVELCSLAATILYCVPFIGLHHRHVLRKIVTSFNFVFFSAQVTAAHICVCDFFRWTSRCVVLVATSWIWIHWVLLLDALTPTVRMCVFFHIRVAAAVFTLCIGSAVVLIYELVFSSAPNEGFHDRVVWHGFIFDQSITFRVAPFFYNCFVTVFVLSLRLLWRLCTVPNDVLVVLDGVVICNNYLSKKTTSRFTSRTTTRERSRRWGSMWRQPPRTQIMVLPAPN